MNDNQIAVYLALDNAYKTGNVLLTNRVEAIVAPQEIKLPDALQEIYDSLKDSPILEPELYAVLEKDDLRLEGFTQAIAGAVNLDDFDAIIASEFVSRCRFKILNTTDKDGVFKSSPTLDNVSLPKMSVIKQLAEDWNKGMTVEAFTDRAVEVAVPSGTVLTEWERNLVGELYLSYAVSFVNSIKGVVTDRTPFSRYLKNV